MKPKLTRINTTDGLIRVFIREITRGVLITAICAEIKKEGKYHLKYVEFRPTAK